MICFGCANVVDVVSLGSGPFLSQFNWFHIAGSALFIAASLLQHQCIVLLAKLRIGKSGELVVFAKYKKNTNIKQIRCHQYLTLNEEIHNL